jgi:hypothetical protein
MEDLIAQKLSEIKERPGHNLYRAYEIFTQFERTMYVLTESGSTQSTEDLDMMVNKIVSGMIKNDGEQVRRNFRRMEETPNGIKSEIRRLRRLDRDRFYDVSYAVEPWKGELYDHDVMQEEPEYESGEEYVEDVVDSVPDLISNNRIFEEKIQKRLENQMSPIVEEAKEDNTGVDVKFIGTSHESALMIESIKEEIEDCELLMVESSSTESFSPSRMIGHRAASAKLAHANEDIVEVLNGYPDGVDSKTKSKLMHIIQGETRHNLKERQKRLDRDRARDPDRFKRVISDRDHKFALQAVEYIVEHYYKRGIGKAAIIAGKDHIPGIYGYFDDLGFGENIQSQSGSNPESNSREDKDSLLEW